MYRYDVDIPSTDRHKHSISFTGSKEEIDALKNKGPKEITCTENINKWLVRYTGSDNGVLDIKAEKYVGNKTYVVQVIIPSRVKRFATIDSDEYDPYNPSDTGVLNSNWVELDDHLERTSPGFTKEFHERRYPRSSILSTYEFLRDEQFENMLKSIKVDDNA